MHLIADLFNLWGQYTENLQGAYIGKSSIDDKRSEREESQKSLKLAQQVRALFFFDLVFVPLSQHSKYQNHCFVPKAKFKAALDKINDSKTSDMKASTPVVAEKVSEDAILIDMKEKLFEIEEKLVLLDSKSELKRLELKIQKYNL